MTNENISRKEEIVLRATELFHRQGFVATSLEDIASVVGIKREGIYYYFKDRSEILYAVIKPTSDALLSGLKKVIALPITATERLHLAIKHHLNFFNSNNQEMEIIFRAVYAKAHGNRSASLTRTWSTYGDLWTELIQSGMNAREFDANLNPKLVCQALLGSCNTLSTWYSPNGKITVNDLVDTYFSLFINGLSADNQKKDKHKD